MIDLHSHVLPGLDDGAQTLEESVEIARAAVADGIRVLAATPHVRDDFPTEPGEMERAVAGLRVELERQEVPLELRPGGEIALDRLDGLAVEELRRFGLGGNHEYLLVEFPYVGWPLDLPDRLFRLRVEGFTPVLAHPERNADVQFAPERLAPLVEAGTLVQLTAASIDGRVGRNARGTALRLLELGLAHVVASDAHAPDLRAIGMSTAAEAIGDEALARWLCEELPAAIVDARDLPERPQAQRRGWLSRFGL